jgi:hypothetical protein
MTRALSLSLALLAACGDVHLDAFAREWPGTAPGSGTGGAAGSAGGSNAGGSSGTAPLAGTGGREPPSRPLLIDDFEDQNTQCSASDGYWYQTSDGTGVQAFGVEADSTRAESSFALHASGVGFTVWGSLLGVNLAGTKSYFDVTGYEALRFWARAAPGTTRTLTVSLLETNLHYQTEIELGDDWREYVFPFRSASVPDDAPAFDPAVLSAIQFFVLTDEAFDFWLDDLTFTPAASTN